MKKRAVFINRFFAPDHSATAQILADLTNRINLADIEVHIITSRLLYSGNDELLTRNEVINGSIVHRVATTNFGRGNTAGRLFDYLSFYVSSFIVMLSIVRKGDILIAKTDPPLISIPAAIVSRIKKATLINWLQDIFPEVAAQLNVKMLKKGPLFNSLRCLRNWSLRQAKKNVVLGNKMSERVAREVDDHKSIVIIPNWVVGNDMKPVARVKNQFASTWKLEEKFIIGYSGNLGRAHDYKTILKAIESLSIDASIEFLFVGGGAGYELLKNSVEEKQLRNVTFRDYQSKEQLSSSLSLPDLHLISLEENLEGLIVPSKLYGILAVGRPMIFLGDKFGEVGTLISEYNLGYSVATGDISGFLEAINILKDKPELRETLGKNARLLYETKFSPETSSKAWSEILSDV